MTTDTYEKAHDEFWKLPHVNFDDLDGTISHLVFRAQHELDIFCEGDWAEDMWFTAAEERKLRRFIQKYGTPTEIARMNEDTPEKLAKKVRAEMTPIWIEVGAQRAFVA